MVAVAEMAAERMDGREVGCGEVGVGGGRVESWKRGVRRVREDKLSGVRRACRMGSRVSLRQRVAATVVRRLNSREMSRGVCLRRR